MKIGIISDTHGHEMAWAHACERFFKGADLIVHAGDVLYHGPRNPMKADYNPAGLVARINSCPVPVVIAKGNEDLVAVVNEVINKVTADGSYQKAYDEAVELAASLGL